MHITTSQYCQRLITFSYAGLAWLLIFWLNSALATSLPLPQTHSVQQVQHWEQLLATTELTPVSRFDALLQLAVAYQAAGQAQQAQMMLSRAENLLNQEAEPLRYALLYSIYSDLALARRADVQARQYADRSMAVLPSKAPPLIQATLLNNRGNVETVEAYYSLATTSYREALALAEQTPDIILQARILTNLAQALFRQQHWPQMLQQLTQAQLRLERLDPQTVAYLSGLLSIAELLLRLYEQHYNALDKHSQNSLKVLLLAVLEQAKTSAKDLDAPRLHAYAHGYLGHWYELQQAYDQALQATRQAIFFAQQVDASEILYRWQWQAARVFRQQGQIESALNAYRSAVSHLAPVRQALTVGYRNAFQSFRDTVGPLYFELADLLLQQAQDAPPAARKTWLLEARDTIERLKTAELQDYFQDDCVTATPHPVLLGETSAPHTAVLYPIILPDRLEILLSLPNGIQQFNVALTAEQLKDEVNEFRFELETRTTEAFMPYAQRLYRWLIAPLEATLQAQQVHTLIVVPDGVLRTIPFAALHTGKAFLIQRYALVTTPGLSLMQSAVTQSRPPKILINGLTVAVQDYRALPSVQTEVKQIEALYKNNATVLMNQEFTEAQFAAALKTTAYDLIHIASHGQFSSDPNKTLLLTYDGHLTMNRLERLIRLSDVRNEPIDLLSLSACQTAVGDDQAALGLAGVALKAGARSALATLWFIDDEASSLLVSEFYRQLQLQQRNKAEALQQAQQHLLQQDRYRHPVFWAPFLLIGHWL